MTRPAPEPRPLPTIDLLGRSIHAITEQECISHVMEELAAERGGWIVTPNLDHLRRLVQDKEFARLCGGATLHVPDGRPLLWAAKLQGTPLPGLVAGSNLIRSLSSALGEAKRSAYFLGGDPGTAEAAAEKLQAEFPGLVIAGSSCPPFGFEKEEAYVSAMHEELRSKDPDVVWVALGSPKQEVLIESLRELLPRAWFAGIGISFSFVSGDVKRAPRWMQRTGLEWLHRLSQEPRRLARRYLIDGLPFAARLLGTSALRRLQR
ncbi:MAG: WecB/TagA/CpsF family glycosyltransferase [Planctomycetota bacterium]